MTSSERHIPLQGMTAMVAGELRIGPRVLVKAVHCTAMRICEWTKRRRGGCALMELLLVTCAACGEDVCDWYVVAEDQPPINMVQIKRSICAPGLSCSENACLHIMDLRNKVHIRNLTHVLYKYKNLTRTKILAQASSMCHIHCKYILEIRWVQWPCSTFTTYSSGGM